MPDGWLFRYIKSKNTKSSKYKRELADKICGHGMKYVTESDPESGDRVIGKSCTCRVDENRFTVTNGDGERIFCAAMETVSLFELMSLDGAVISGLDEVSGEKREITVHYSYYR